MEQKHPKLEFKNKHSPASSFDLVDLKTVLHSKYDNHSPFALHQIEFFTIVLYTKGEEVHTIDFTNYECKEGTILFLRKGQIHKFSNNEVEGSILVFTYDFLAAYFTKSEVERALLLFNEFLKQPVLNLPNEQKETISNLIDQIKQEYLEAKDEHSPKIIRSFVQVIIDTMYRIKPLQQTNEANKKYLTDFIRFQQLIEQDFNPSVKVKDYAQALGLHTKTLNAITHRVVGKSAKTFIDEIRVNNIKRQLLNSEQSIKEVAYKCGFIETTNFNNYFKKRVDKTPLEFRKNKQ